MRAAPLCLAALLVLAAPAARALEPTYDVVDNALVVPRPVVFVTGKATLDGKASAEALSYVRGYLAERSYVTTLRIEVHTDGATKGAQALSEQRALAVAHALVARGVACERLLPVGFGATKPVAAEDTAAGRAQNRRTAFVNAALRGRAIGGMPLDGGGRVAGDPCK